MTLMSKATPAARKVASKVAYKLEQLALQLWEGEDRLTAAGGSGADPEAAKLAAVFGCVCVDFLYPAIESLRQAIKPTRQPEEESEDEAAALPEALA
jgi:hypothetical protein